jgi:hypothetical protein
VEEEEDSEDLMVVAERRWVGDTGPRVSVGSGARERERERGIRALHILLQCGTDTIHQY